MRLALSVLIIPLLAACVFVPDGVYGDSHGMSDLRLPSVSYKLQPPPPAKIFTGSETVYLNNYELNETMVAKVGDTVLRVQAFRQDNYINQAFLLEKPVTVTVKREKMHFPAKKYSIVGTFERDGETFYALPKIKRFYFLVNSYGEFQPLFLYEKRNSKDVSIFPDKAKFEPSARLKRLTSFERPKLPFSDFEVVYQGIKDNQIVMFFKNAIPGTNGGAGGFDTISYPIDSTMISIEGRLLRILQATEEQLVFIVVRD